MSETVAREPMRVFIHTVTVQALDVTPFAAVDKSWVPGLFTISGYGPQGQDIVWTQHALVTPGTYVERVVECRIEQQPEQVTWVAVGPTLLVGEQARVGLPRSPD